MINKPNHHLKFMRVTIVQFYTDNVSYGKFSEAINKKYCGSHGYSYFVENNTQKLKQLAEDRAFTWIKPKIILEELEKNECDYVLFMDIDAIVCDHSIKIEDFIDENFDIVATEDYSSHCLMNAGILLIKNSDWSKNFMKEWWESGNFLRGMDSPEWGAKNEVPGYFKNALWHDQTCLTYLYRRENRREHIKILPNKILNWREYKDGNFIFHAFAYGNLKNRKIDTAYYELFDIKLDLKDKNLVELCEYFPCDKEYDHNYISKYYQEMFEPIKNTTKRFCEIGNNYKCDLASARLWREYFQDADIIICEANIKDNNEKRIKIVQFNIDQIDNFCESQENFDVILDDGNHKMMDQQVSFAKLFKKLNPNGLYIIEDLHTSIEAKMPEKAAFGWGDPSKTTTLEMLENFEKTGKIRSDYISLEDANYIEKNCEFCKVFRKENQSWSITSSIKKKGSTQNKIIKGDGMYLNIPYKIYYDTNKFPFKSIVCDMLDVDYLEHLHLLESYELLERKKDQSTTWHKKYYEKFEKYFNSTYIDLINYIKDSYGYKELIYQKIPTFRVQLGNGNVAVGEWHKDKTYNHGISEVNFWMPFVDTNCANSVWIESKEDLGDYKPYEVKYGEILIFNGANLNHGNKRNMSGKTRVSVDFRLVDPEKFTPNQSGSINMQTKFDIGGYFEAAK